MTYSFIESKFSTKAEFEAATCGPQATELASRLQGCSLTYFRAPGRAESIRMALVLGGITFTNTVVHGHGPHGHEWQSLKPTTPWGSMPILKLADGTEVGQQRAILRFVGKATQTYPDDPIAAAHVDAACDVVVEIFEGIMGTGGGLPQEKKEAARLQSVADGPTATALRNLEKFIGKHGGNGFSVGSSTTIADLMIANILTFFTFGNFDGLCLHSRNSYTHVTFTPQSPNRNLILNLKLPQAFLLTAWKSIPTSKLCV